MFLGDRIVREEDGRKIPGALVPAFIHNQDYFFTQLRVFQDGMVDCWGLVSFERFKFKVEEGWVVTALPEGAQVSIHDLGRFEAKNVKNGVAEQELVKHVADVIEALNGRPDSSAKCRDALKHYKEHPGEEARMLLQQAYEAVPAHRRMFLGDQDRKDIPIRMIIYGTDSIEDWSHRKASKQVGLPAPTIDTSEYLDEVFPTPKQVLNARLSMALSTLYRGNGLAPADFSGERYDAVEKLFREQREEDGLRELFADLEQALATQARRPSRAMVLARTLSAIGEYFEHRGQVLGATANYLRALKLNPDDSSAEIGLAKLAVRGGDRALAKALLDVYESFGLPPKLRAGSMAKFLGLDVEAFNALVR